MSELDRRDFLKVAGVGAGALLAGCATAPGFLKSGRSSSNVVVVGGGSWGTWTALNLQRQGARVTLIDMYGPGNSRATSGDESRGVRSSYGDRVQQGEQWMKWARLSMQKWKDWDAEYAKRLGMPLFFTTGDLLMRAGPEPFTTRNIEWWTKLGIPHEVLTADEVRKRWPVFKIDDITVAVYEPDAGVVRARRSCEAVAEVFKSEGGRLVIQRVVPPEQSGFDGSMLTLMDGTKVGADAFVFCCGPWLGKTFDLMKNRMRTPLGQVFYYGTPPGDTRFLSPGLPSWNFPGVTGWGGLPQDNRGFRVRGGGGGGGGGQQNAANQANAGAAAANPPATPPTTPPANPPATTTTPPVNVQDPDLSSRYIDTERLPRQRAFLEARFPLLKDMPLLATHACHYEQSASRNFIIAKHPNLANIWIVGGGNAEGLKFGPVIGEYATKRVLGIDKDEEFARQFRIPENEYQATPTGRPGSGDGEAEEEF